MRYSLSLRAIAYLVCVSTLLPTGRAASEPLQPLKPWLMHSGATQCAALRQYGKKENPFTLIIRPDPTGRTYDLMISSRRSGPSLALVRAGLIVFAGKGIVREAMDYQIKGRPFSTYQFRLSSAEMEQARTASKADIFVQNGLSDSFALEGMQAVFDGLRRCTERLQAYWNVNSTVSARGDVRSIFSTNDYPPGLAWTGRGGRVQYLLLIDEHGSVAGCYVVEPSGSAQLDSMGCEVIQERAKFTPARDSNGNAVRSAYVTPFISWQVDN